MSLKIDGQPQWLATAWLRETGEHRPAVDILRSNKPLSPDLRNALADWIAKGSKRRKGSKVPRDPWREYPPKLAESCRIPTTPKEKRAWLLFVAFPITPEALLALSAGKHTRGRPLTLGGASVAYVARKLGISKQTARAWRKRFFSDNLAE